jgi:hypothetical protein
MTAALAALALVVLAGCDTNDGAAILASFVPEAVAPAPGTVTMAEAEQAGELVSVDVLVSGVDDLFGADFDVLFDPVLVEFVAWEPQALLGTQPIATIAAAAPGHLVVGASRHGSEGAIDVGAAAALLRLTFRALDAGSSGVSFDHADLLPVPGSGGPGTIGGLSWHGGTVVAVTEE